MDYRFEDSALELLFTRGEGQESYPKEVVQAFLRRVAHIQAAVNEQDLRTPKSVHFERLKGKLKGKCSLRLNKNWRLVLSITKGSTNKLVVIHEITNHYQ